MYFCVSLNNGICKLVCLCLCELIAAVFEHTCDKSVGNVLEYENFLFLYRAYKALRGNSFIDKIKKEVDEWEVVTR